MGCGPSGARDPATTGFIHGMSHTLVEDPPDRLLPEPGIRSSGPYVLKSSGVRYHLLHTRAFHQKARTL